MRKQVLVVYCIGSVQVLVHFVLYLARIIDSAQVSS